MAECAGLLNRYACQRASRVRIPFSPLSSSCNSRFARVLQVFLTVSLLGNGAVLFASSGSLECIVMHYSASCGVLIGLAVVVNWRVFFPTHHERAVNSVNHRDGWAREDGSGFVIADLNRGTIPITNSSSRDLVECERPRDLSASGTEITDSGLAFLVGPGQRKSLG